MDPQKNTLAVSAEMVEKYGHYEYLRVKALCTSEGYITTLVLQGWNKKEWVRAKAKKKAVCSSPSV